jgi:hypothetical protein
MLRPTSPIPNHPSGPRHGKPGMLGPSVAILVLVAVLMAIELWARMN